MKRILFLILIIATTVFCQSRKTIVIDDFSYGVNSVLKGYSEIPYANLNHNTDLTIYPMNLTQRLGFDSVFSLFGIDSFLWNGIQAINYRDGTKQLGLVADSSGVGYANIYVTDQNTVDLGVSDSIWLVPDTTSYFGNYALPASPYSTIFYIKKNKTQYKKVEADRSTAFTKAEVVDSFVAIINADAELSPRITASDLGDTLLIVDDSSDLETNFIFYTTDSSALVSPAGDYSRMRVVKSKSFQTSTGNRIHTRFPATGQLWWSQFQGVTYLGTGTGKAISYDGKTVNTFPMRAPGEPNIIPLTTSGNLNGRYRYAFKYSSPVDSVADTVKYATFSYLSQPIIVDSGQVMLWDFPLPTRDYYYEGEDTVSIEVWRSVGDIGVLDRADSVFFTGITISFADSGGYSDTVIIDTASDATIRANAGQVFADGNFYSWQSGTIDTTIHRYYSKPGAPSIVSWGDAIGNLGMWGSDASTDSLNDTLTWGEAAGFSYMCVYVDTNLNIPSDSSRSLNYYQAAEVRGSWSGGSIYTIYDDSTYTISGVDTFTLGFARKSTEKMTIALPYADGVNGVLLYRGVIQPMQFDTSFIKKTLRRDNPFGKDIYFDVDIPFVSSDSFAVPYYYLIGAFTPGDTVVDSLCYDSLVSREVYQRNAVPPVIKQMISYKNQLIAHDGQYIYESNATADSVAFNVFSKNPINIDDGDEITTLIPQYGIIKVLKNKSSYILKQNLEGYWRDLEASKYYGCVSQFSHIPAPEGDYFLSRDGFRLENENIYRSNSNIGSLMSSQINAFTRMTSAEQRQCFGVNLDDNKAVLSFPALDTSFVLFKTVLPNGEYRYGWGTWDNLVMCGATKYDVRADNYVYPGDTTYFIKSGSNGVYRYGTSTYDNGEVPWMVWGTHQLTDLFSGYKQITDLYIEAESSDTADSNYFVIFYDETQSVVNALRKELPRLDTSYTYMYEMPDAPVKKSWKIVISNDFTKPTMAETIFKRIDIGYNITDEILVR